MEWYIVGLIILAIIVFIMILPLFLSASVYINAVENLGVVRLALWGVTLTCFQIELKKTTLRIIRRKKKDKEVKLKLIDPNMILAENFAKAIFRGLIIREVSIFFSGGKKNDACASGLCCGTVLQFCYILFALLFNAKGEIKSYISVDQSIEEDELKIAAYTGIIITPILIIIGAILAIIRTKRRLRIYEKYLYRGR